MSKFGLSSSGSSVSSGGRGTSKSEANSEICPNPTAWWLRPVSSAARVGEQIAVVWNRLNRTPRSARRSIVGMRTGPPKHSGAEKPASSDISTRMCGGSSPRREGSRRHWCTESANVRPATLALGVAANGSAGPVDGVLMWILPGTKPQP